MSKRNFRSNSNPTFHSNRDDLINAAALQDQFSRNLALPQRFNLSHHQKKLPPKPANRLHNAGKHIMDEVRWQCDTCTFLNPQSSKKCQMCGSDKPNYNDTELDNPSDDPVLTLAQKRGLVKGPDKLTKEQWNAVFKRAITRKDAEQPCPICQENYKLTPQVILSCSHVFHLNCLSSFEKFVSREKRVCPICRRNNYQKREFNEGTKVYRRRCIVRIQSFYRGYKARKMYDKKLSKLYKSGKGNTMNKRKYITKKMNKITSKIDETVDNTDVLIDSLFADLERNIKASRMVFNNEEPKFEYLAAEKPVNKWIHIKKLAMKHYENECPICLNSYKNGDVLLLSCSHIFHSKCIQSFEKFNANSIHLCPICRSAYDCTSFFDVPDEE